MQTIVESILEKATETLQKGGVILYPTDTVWGLGCDATNNEAISKIEAIKGKTKKQGLICLLSDTTMLHEYVSYVPLKAFQLIEVYEQPLTVIFNNPKGIASAALAEDGSAAIRIPKFDICRLLIEKFGKPITSTSANIHGESPSHILQNISTSIFDKVDFVVDIPNINLSEKAPSKIIRFNENDELEVIRD